MIVDAMAYIFVSPLLLRSLRSGNRTFDFNCGIDLNFCTIVMVEWCEEF